MEPIKVAGTDKFRHEISVKLEALIAEQPASLQCRAGPDWLAELVANELHSLSEIGCSALAVTASFGPFDSNGGGFFRISLKGKRATSQPLFAETSGPITKAAAKSVLEDASYAAAIQPRVSAMVGKLVDLTMAQCAVVHEITQFVINLQAATGEPESWQIQHLPSSEGYRIRVQRLLDSSRATSIIVLDQSPHGTWHSSLGRNASARYPSEARSAVASIRNLMPGARLAQVLSCIREANKPLEHLILQQMQC